MKPKKGKKGKWIFVGYEPETKMILLRKNPPFWQIFWSEETQRFLVHNNLTCKLAELTYYNRLPPDQIITVRISRGELPPTVISYRYVEKVTAVHLHA